MKVLRSAPLEGEYELVTLPPVQIDGGHSVLAGLVHFGAGKRSPETGVRTSAMHELGYVVRGRLLVETATERWEIKAGDMLASSPAAPHSTTALEDSEIFFALVDPHLAAQS